MNRAILSSDKNLDYAFFAPITSLLWVRMGYRPLVFLVGTVAEWIADPRLRLALEWSREVGAEVHFVPEVEGMRTSTVAQIVRIFGAFASGIGKDDYLVTGDVDMFSLGSWIGGGIDPYKDLQIWYSNAYDQSEYPHWPMCYIGAKAKTWWEIVGDGDLLDLLAAAMGGCPKDESGAWNWDERLLGGLIAKWNRSERTQFIPRTFVEGEWRIDRGDWDGAMAELEKRGSLSGVADAHVLRPGFTAENWPRIRRLLEIALPSSQLAWVDQYVKKWQDVC